MGAYQQDRKWSDAYLPELRRLIGPHLLVPSSLEQDRREAADLVVLKARDVTVACRVRRTAYAEKYAGQFTLRSRRDNGVKTELQKITEGWGDWLFYGFAAGEQIAPWWLIDLSAFRAQFIREGMKKTKRIHWGEQQNGDGTYFCWFTIASFSSTPPLLIANASALSQEGVVSASEIRW